MLLELLKALLGAAKARLSSGNPGPTPDSVAVSKAKTLLDGLGGQFPGAVPVPEVYAQLAEALEGSTSDPVASFTAIYSGQMVGWGQSMELVDRYMADITGGTFSRPTLGCAKDLWYWYFPAKQALMDRIPVWEQGQRGDIGVWDGTQGLGYGVMGIVLATDRDSVLVFTQILGHCGPVRLPKSGLLGYFRPKTPEKGQK